MNRAYLIGLISVFLILGYQQTCTLWLHQKTSKTIVYFEKINPILKWIGTGSMMVGSGLAILTAGIVIDRKIDQRIMEHFPWWLRWLPQHHRKKKKRHFYTSYDTKKMALYSVGLFFLGYICSFKGA